MVTGEFGGMIGWVNRSTRRKPAPVSLCPPQTPHAVRMRTRAAVVGSQGLTTSATARPYLPITFPLGHRNVRTRSNKFLTLGKCWPRINFLQPKFVIISGSESIAHAHSLLWYRAVKPAAWEPHSALKLVLCGLSNISLYSPKICVNYFSTSKNSILPSSQKSISKLLLNIDCNLGNYLSLLPVVPFWSIGHQWNALFRLGFLILRQSVELLGRGISPLQGQYLYKERANTEKHPCLAWDSNPRSHRWSERKHFMP
jgi:hypothetical protein